MEYAWHHEQTGKSATIAFRNDELWRGSTPAVGSPTPRRGIPRYRDRSASERGEPRIVRTRIPVWVLEQARRLRTIEAEILRSYPSLRAEDLTNAWAYVRAHREEINKQIEESEAE